MAIYSTNYKSVFDDLMAHCRAPHHHISVGFKVRVYFDRLLIDCLLAERYVLVSILFIQRHVISNHRHIIVASTSSRTLTHSLNMAMHRVIFSSLLR